MDSSFCEDADASAELELVSALLELLELEELQPASSVTAIEAASNMASTLFFILFSFLCVAELQMTFRAQKRIFRFLT